MLLSLEHLAEISAGPTFDDREDQFLLNSEKFPCFFFRSYWVLGRPFTTDVPDTNKNVRRHFF